MRFVLKATADDSEDWSGYAVVTLEVFTRQRQLRSWRASFQALKKEHDSLDSMSFFGPCPFYFDTLPGDDVDEDELPRDLEGNLLSPRHLLTEEEATTLEDRGWVAFPENRDVGQLLEGDVRVDCDRLVIDDEGVGFQAIREPHGISTWRIPWEAVFGE